MIKSKIVHKYQKNATMIIVIIDDINSVMESVFGENDDLMHKRIDVQINLCEMLQL